MEFLKNMVEFFEANYDAPYIDFGENVFNNDFYDRVDSYDSFYDNNEQNEYIDFAYDSNFGGAYIQEVAAPKGYYDRVKKDAKNEDLMDQLQEIIEKDKKVLSYKKAWDAFKEVDKHLPGYPCSSDKSKIPDIYSGYCWTPRKDVNQGQCGKGGVRWEG